MVRTHSKGLGMTSSDNSRIFSVLDGIRNDLADVKADVRVTTEKLEHVPSWTDIKEEVTQRIEIAQAKCNTRNRPSNKATISWASVAKISVLLTAGLTPVAVTVASVLNSTPTP